MSIPCSTPSTRPRCSRRNRAAAPLALLTLLAAAASPAVAPAQQIVFDPKNNAEAVVQSARLLQQLTNQTAQLAGQARMLAASPVRQSGQISGTVGAIQQLSQTVEGLAADASGVERQFGSLYSTSASGQSLPSLISAGAQRLATALKTAQDLARLSAQVQSLSQTRSGRVQTTLQASETAQGQTAALQSTNQLLGVLAEELASLRALLAAQSRLLAEAAARQGADRTAAMQAHQQLWGRPVSTVAAPSFEPLSQAMH